MIDNADTQTDTHFEPLSVAAEAVVSRLRKARLRAERGDRLGWIVEQREKRGATSMTKPPLSFPARGRVQTRAGTQALIEAVNRI